jgi:hypothetical protein
MNRKRIEIRIRVDKRATGLDQTGREPMDARDCIKLGGAYFALNAPPGAVIPWQAVGHATSIQIGPRPESSLLYTLFSVLHIFRPGVEGQNGGSK